MKKIHYHLIFDAGSTADIYATSRSEAIRSYCKQTGMPTDFLKKHCRIEIAGTTSA